LTVFRWVCECEWVGGFQRWAASFIGSLWPLLWLPARRLPTFVLTIKHLLDYLPDLRKFTCQVGRYLFFACECQSLFTLSKENIYVSVYFYAMLMFMPALIWPRSLGVNCHVKLLTDYTGLGFNGHSKIVYAHGYLSIKVVKSHNNLFKKHVSVTSFKNANIFYKIHTKNCFKNTVFISNLSLLNLVK